MWNFCQSRENLKNWAFAGNFFFTRFSQFQLNSRHFKCSSNKTSSKIFAQTRNKFFLNTLRPECFRPKCSFGYVGCKYDNKSLIFFRVNNEKHSHFSGNLKFITKSVPLYLEAEKFRRPAKIHSISFQKRISFWKALIDFFKLFPWKRNMQIGNPHTESFCSKRRRTRIYKVPPENYVISRFFSLIMSTVVMKSQYKVIFGNVSKGSKIFNISMDVCWKSSFWQLKSW